MQDLYQKTESEKKRLNRISWEKLTLSPKKIGKIKIKMGWQGQWNRNSIPINL